MFENSLRARRRLRADLPARLPLLAAAGHAGRADAAGRPRRPSRSARRGCAQRARQRSPRYLEGQVGARSTCWWSANGSGARRISPRCELLAPGGAGARWCRPASPRPTAGGCRASALAPKWAAVSDTPENRAACWASIRRSEAPPLPADRQSSAAEPGRAPPPESGDAVPTEAARREPPKKQGWFQRLKAGLTKTSAKLSEDITGLFTKRKLDADTLEELEDLLIQADLGVETAMRITEALSKGRYDKEIAPEEVRAVLAAEVERMLAPVAKPLRLDAPAPPARHPGRRRQRHRQDHHHRQARAAVLAQQGKKVMLAAGDTFRAAAIDQLKIWGERTGAAVIARAVGADAAGLAFDALKPRARATAAMCC